MGELTPKAASHDEISGRLESDIVADEVRNGPFSPSTSERVTWIDLARGLAIILIVMHHCRDYALALLPPQPGDIIRWAYIDPFLVHIRLPLFFTLSGMLAFGISGRKSWTSSARRTSTLTIVYVTWSVVMMCIIPNWPNDDWRPLRGEDFLGIVSGLSVLWYFWAVILAFLFCSATRFLPAIAAILIALAVGLAISVYGHRLGASFASFGRYLPLYVLGARYGAEIVQLSQWRSLTAAGVLLTTYLLLLNPAIVFYGVDLARNGLGAALGVMASAWLAKASPVLASKFGWLGRRTLPIYVLHFPIVAYLGCAAIRAGAPEPRALVLLTFLPLLTIAALAGALGLLAIISRMGLGWTLAMPKPAKASF